VARITATATVSFTVPQVIAVSRGIGGCRAAARGMPGRFAVLMIGRLDDYREGG
jgi:hypothetical protein